MYYSIHVLSQHIYKYSGTNCLQLETLDKLVSWCMRSQQFYKSEQSQVSNPVVMERISIICLVIILIFSLEREGQTTSDPTLRLDRRYDQVIRSPKGTSIVVTFYGQVSNQ